MSIKICKFTFAEVESKDHWVDFYKFGECLNCECHQYNTPYEVPQIEAGDSVWQVGLDQSTTCCGIFAKDYTNSTAYMIEISRSRRTSVDDSIFNIEMLMHRLFEKCKVSHLIYEATIDTGSFRSSQVLFQLEGCIRALTKRYPEFQTARLESIANASWRSVIILENYKDFERKDATERTMHAVYPWTRGYGFSLGDDNDVFEAMGVMFGWFLQSYDALGRPYVRGERFNGSIGGFILPNVSSSEVAEQFKQLGLKACWYVEHPNHSIYDNLSEATRRYEIACVQLTSKYAMLAMCVECNVKWEDYDKMTVVLTAANYVDQRLFTITGDTYHFVI